LSLLDVLEFNAKAYTEAFRDLVIIEKALDVVFPRLEKAFFRTADEPLGDDWCSRVLTALDSLENHCEILGLDGACTLISLIRKKIGPECQARNISDLVVSLRDCIEDQLSKKVFFYLPTELVPYYRATALFGEKVASKFRKASFDLSEAGKSFACGRWTASVFHLMRAIEIGTRRFAKKLGVVIGQRDTLGTILTNVDQAIGAMPHANPKERTRQIAFRESSANLRAVKEAWRNPSFHAIIENYSKEDAEAIFQAVKVFMQQLAEIV
jgi:HEPN domain-containing protein